MSEKNVLAGRYRLDEQIATGGMGAVWRAHDTVLQRPVAVKLLHDALAADVSAAERFKREALLAASISHPNMANVFDYIEEDGRPGIVMELVEGETLSALLARRGSIPPEDATRIAVGVLDALIVAHDAGIVHRDIKPGNVLLVPDGTVKVADFGIARSLSDATLTATGTVMGTAHYSAPEQVTGAPTTASSDLYSLGVVLYEMLTGTKPFKGDTAVSVAMARLTETPAGVRSIDPQIPAALDEVVMRTLERDPMDRYPDGRAMRQALLDGLSAPAAIDRTQVLTPAHDDETIALARGVAPPALKRKEERPLPDVVPPAWWGRRVMLVLLPLVLLGVLGLTVRAMTADQGLLGPSTVKVPKLKGMTASEARAAANKAGLAVDIDRISHTGDEDVVVSQKPAPGTEVASDSTVVLRVSLGDLVNVPNLRGKTESEARQALEDRGLEPGERSFRLTGDEGLRVVDQSPDHGKDVERGTKVDYVIALAEQNRDDGGKGRGKGRKGKGDD